MHVEQARFLQSFDALDDAFALIEVIFENSHPVDYRFVHTNASFERHTGLRDAVGRTVRELLPTHVVQGFYGEVVRTGEPVRFQQSAPSLGRHYDVLAFRVGDPEAHRVGVLFSDTTERRNAEERSAFAQRLSEALKPVADPIGIQEVAARLLGEQLNASRVFYSEVNDDERTVVVHRDFTAEVPSIEGTWTLADFGDSVVSTYRAGKDMSVTDVHADPRFTATQRAAHDALQIRAYLGTSLVKHGRLVAILVVNDVAPREWSSHEIALARDVAERTWAAVEQARAEAALAASEAEYGTLFDSVDDGVSTLDVIFDADGRCIDFRNIAANPALERVTGLPRSIVGKRASEYLPSVDQRWLDLFARIVTTGTPERGEYFVADINRWMSFFGSRVGGPGSCRMVCVYSDITPRMRDMARRDFLLQVSDAVRTIIDTGELQDTTLRLLAQHLGVERVGYFETELDDDEVHASREYAAPGLPPWPRLQRISDFGEFVISSYRRGERVVFSDAHADSRLGERERAAFRAIDIRACVGAPIVKGGRLVAALGVLQSLPREWTPDDLALITQISERLWTAIERARGESRLRQSEERYRTLFEAIDEGFCVFDMIYDEAGRPVDYRFVEVNPAFGRHTGLSHAQGRTIKQLVPTQEGYWFDIYGKVAATGEPVRFENRGEGMQRWFDVYAFRLGGPGTHRLGAIFSDITQRKEAEGALRQREARFRALVTAGSEVIYRMSPDWHVMRYLEGGEFIADNLEPSQTWVDAYIHPDDQALVWTHVGRAIATKGAFELEHRVKRVDGSYGWTLSRAIPLLDDRGEVIEWFGASRDVTHRRLAEQALRDADQRKDEFLAMLAHELRTPLAAIHNAAQVLHHVHGNADALSSASSILDRQVTHMVRQMDDLLDVSRISRGKIDLRRERVELATIVTHAVESVRPHAESLGHELAVSLPTQRLFVHGDATRLTQVVVNLLNNAFKFTPNGGRIAVVVDSGRLETHPAEAVIRVRDTGIGIIAEQLVPIFDIFAQVDHSLERTRDGLGLGLTLVKKLVEMHGGTVEAHSEGLGRGSEFVVRLPRESAGQPTVEPNDRPSTSSPRRMLVVDDSHDSANSLAMLLALMGHEVETAYDGVEALEKAHAFDADIVLLDIGMPKLNGYETASRLRAQARAKRVRIIALTGWGQEEDRTRSREAGFDAHLVKPIELTAFNKLLSGWPSD